MSDHDTPQVNPPPDWLWHDHTRRIAVLEHRFDRHERDFAEHRRVVESKLGEISDTLTKQKGTLGGIMLSFTAIATVLTLFKDWIFRHFS